MAVPINIFNPNQFAIQVSINHGNPASIPGAGPAQNWQPQQVNQNPWSYSDRGPQPNSLGGGMNQLAITGAGGEPTMLMINIPRLPISSLQLYVFLGQQSSWILLNNGQTIASGTA